ncbi:MAG: hypothetical protein JWQ40_509 [Segetibacter sp.]|nr:hypothetical protein [Segetibacter sp.]
MLPLFSLATPGEPVNKSVLKPETLKFGTGVNTVNKFLNNKSRKLSNEVTFYYLKINTVQVENVKIKDAFLVSDNGTITSFSLELDKHNGAKLLADYVKKYGMPVGDVIDVLEWKDGDMVFEIHETEAGYLATYTPATPEPLLAVTNNSF